MPQILATQGVGCHFAICEKVCRGNGTTVYEPDDLLEPSYGTLHAPVSHWRRADVSRAEKGVTMPYHGRSSVEKHLVDKYKNKWERFFTFTIIQALESRRLNRLHQTTRRSLRCGANGIV